MKDSEKFDNRDDAPAKPKKEKDVGEGVYEGSKSRSASPKDLPAKGNKIGKEGNAFGKAVQDAKASGDKTMTVGGKTMPVKESERTMSRAAKGHEKYGKEGMAALAKAGKEGKDLDKVRDKYDKYDESVESGGKKKCPPMSHIKKMCKDGKSLAEICKMHSDCDQKELKQMVADCKKQTVRETTASEMWKNIKETTAYMAEKKAAAKKIKDVETDEGNEFSGELKKARDEHKDSFKVDGKTFPVKESSEVSRLRELTGRLNQNEKQSLVESGDVASIRALTQKLLG